MVQCSCVCRFIIELLFITVIVGVIGCWLA